MQAIPRTDPTQAYTIPSSGPSKTWAGQVASVGRWMTVLGIVRLVCASIVWAALVGTLTSHASTPSPASVGRSFFEQPPIVFLGMIWPVALGILVSRTRWPELLRAASVTFFLLAASGLIAFILGWSLESERPIAVGSFKINRSELSLSAPSGVAIALIGMAQLIAELYVAGRSTWLLSQARRSDKPVEAFRLASSEEVTPRTRSILCRGCWIISLLFLLSVVRLPVVPKMSDLINSSPLLRHLLLMNDRAGSSRRINPHILTPQVLAEERVLQSLVAQAATAWEADRYEDASVSYQKAISLYRASEVLQDQQSRNNLALLANNLAWLLATRPDPHPGDAEKAVEYANLALATNPSEGRYWNTLGAAQYRAKNWQGTKDALMRSIELRGDGDGNDWILFALLYSRTGRKDHALEWYNKASRWREDFRPWDQDLYAFEAEAAQRLGLPKPAPPIRRPTYYNRDYQSEMTSKSRGLPMNPYVGDQRQHRRYSHRYTR